MSTEVIYVTVDEADVAEALEELTSHLTDIGIMAEVSA